MQYACTRFLFSDDLNTFFEVVWIICSLTISLAVNRSSENQLVAQLDRNGRHIRLCYDDNGLPHSIYDGSGRHFQPVFSSIRLHDNDPDFDPAGERDVFISEDERFYVNRLTSVTFNGKELVRYDYDDYGDLTAV